MTQDRRIRKSQQAIKTAFIDLLHKYDFNDVTVQQITDLVILTVVHFIRII